jgi:hypothetical protein
MIGLFTLRSSFKILPNLFTLSYDPNLKKDGVGAQVQRILAIYSLSSFLGIDYKHRPIVDVAIHPLDPYKSEEDYMLFLERLNKYFQFPDSQSPTKRKTVHTSIENISLVKFFGLGIKGLFTGSRFEISMINPYKFVDLFPEMYRYSKAYFLQIHDESGNKSEARNKRIVVHYRQGVGGFVIQNGEKYPRELSIEFFLRAASCVLETQGSKNCVLEIYSDAPKQNLLFSPPNSQAYLWSDTPRFKDGVVEIIAADLSAFSKLADTYDIDVTFHHGGDALDAFIAMVTADVLILSKSSLSYIAGLLSPSQKVVYPKGFWHPKLNGWVELR